jgi:DNA-binding transcriptional MerR regulator
MDDLVRSSEAADVLGMTPAKFNEWCRAGVVTPFMSGSGQGSTKIFTVQQVWAIAIAKSVRAGGQSIENACEVAGILERMPPAKIQKWFAEGKTCLLVMDQDGKKIILEGLLSASQILDNKTFKQSQEECRQEGKVLQFTGIDVKPVFDQIIRMVQEKKQAAAKLRTSRRP